jgi:succinyl-diaminopimelate desuccinylase
MKPPDLAALALDLLRVPSPIGQEGPLADLIEARLAALGPALARERIGQSVVARVDRAGARRTIALVGHLDTVPGHVADPVRLEGDRLYGCGASDMKGGLAVMLALLDDAAAAAAGPGGATRGSGSAGNDPGAPADEGPANLVCVFYDREEGPYAESGLGPVLAASRLLGGIDFAFCLEPTAGEVQVGCLGATHATVRFTGRAAHSARPWQGENAIHKAAPFLARVAALAPRDVVVQGLTFREVMTVTTARSHAVRNVVPDFFELNVNFRFAPGKSLGTARTEVLALVAGEAEVAFVDEAPAGPVTLDSPVLRRFLAQTGAPVAPKQAWTDVARLGAAGIPAVNYGPGEPAQAHQAGEWAPLAPLGATRDALARLLAL